ncbi:DsbA family oxidoreductase [Cupriavidus basilensis]
MTPSNILSVEAYFDLICPWCLIGKRHLESAIGLLARERPDVDVRVEWRSYPLIPATPPDGIPYRDFYVARLGSPQAVAVRQAQVIQAAREAGLTLALDRIETFPNTVLAHRLVRFVRKQDGAAVAATLIDKLFTRYFIGGGNIGDGHVLGEVLAECGIQVPAEENAPVRHDMDWLPPLNGPEDPAPRNGVGVPHFIFNGTHSVSGSRPPAALLEAMQRALARAKQIATRAAA